MTLLVSWIGVDPHGTTSAYIAADSRVSWGDIAIFDDFSLDDMTLWSETMVSNFSQDRLILDPEPEEKKDEWEGWKLEEPRIGEFDDIALWAWDIWKWLKRMPRRGG